jgi:prevent-host-death family protein
MDKINIRELRNHGGEVIDRVARGEQFVITRSGKPVAELGPVRRPALPPEVLLSRWRRLPPVNYESLRADLDEILDAEL